MTARRSPSSVVGVVIALCTTLALLPLALATRVSLPTHRSPGRPAPLPVIQPPSLPSGFAPRAGGVADDVELAQLFEADQEERHQLHARATWTPAELHAMSLHDTSRRQRVAQLSAAGGVRTGADWFEAAIIYQHGTTLDDYARARDYGVQAVVHGDERGLWLAAAAWDRWLVNAGYPQRFGTQSTCDVEAGLRTCHLLPYEPATTDEERARWNVPPLAQLLQQHP